MASLSFACTSVKIQENKDWKVKSLSLLLLEYHVLKSKKTRIEIFTTVVADGNFNEDVKIQENKDWNYNSGKKLGDVYIR